jgi:glycosyltransferase involved in cell wall biosynthesis
MEPWLMRSAATMADHLLLVLPLPAFSVNGTVFFDQQACYGLELWLQNFSSLTLACPTYVCENAPADTKTLDSISERNRVTFSRLPVAYSPVTFVKRLPETARLLSALIDSANYLHFAIGGFFGDWGAIAAIIASRRNLPFAIWTDRVESNVIAFQSRSMTGIRSAYYSLLSRLTVLLERYVIRRAAVGLFNGMDCFSAYSRLCVKPHLVANFNFGKDAHISQDKLEGRLAEMSERPLRFVYVGRAHKDKGVADWIDVFADIKDDFHATWIGDGPELNDVRAMIASRRLDQRLSFQGNTPHADTLVKLKSFDAFVFCHKTPESPRCLVEALTCGLPIVGYESAYSRQLIEKNGGGLLTPINNIEALRTAIEGLLRNRERLRTLSRLAAKDGQQYNAEAVFRDRSELMKGIRIEAVAPSSDAPSREKQ